MKISQIVIHNFRGIIHQQFVMNSYTLLIGGNNAGKSSVIDAIRAFYEKDKFTETVFEGVSACSPDLDELIGKYSNGWSSERMSKISLAILRLSVFEMKYLDDVPMSVSINEAVELAKKYDNDDAPAFINGVLNTLAKAENFA